jgi:hypothetical protein
MSCATPRSCATSSSERRFSVDRPEASTYVYSC